MKKIISLFITVVTIHSCSTYQKKNDCDKIMDNELNTTKNFSVSGFENDYKILQKCGKLDNIDTIIFSHQEILALIIAEKSPNKKLTYREILNKINEIRNSENYLTIKEKVRFYAKIRYKKINIEDWDKDKYMLIKLGYKEKKLNDFKKFVTKFNNTDTTYEIALKLFEKQLDTKKTKYQFQTFNDYSQILKKAKLENKYILLYFTGRACQNCRLIESNILSDDQIKSKIENNFLAFELFVDSREKLKEPYISKRTGKKLYTMGAKASDIEIEKFKSNYQPFFVIIDKNDHTIKTQGYTKDLSEFMDFLTIKK